MTKELLERLIDNWCTDKEENYFSSPHNSNQLVSDNYRVRQKSGPLKFFAIFSATVWNFNMKFYSFI